MKTLPPSKSIPAWQTERIRILLRVFHRIDGAILRGEKISMSIRRASRYYAGRKYKSDPSRQIQLTSGTIQRLWGVWNHSGKNPASLKLKYYSRLPYVPRALMIRFVEWFSENHLPSIREAWRKFSALKRNVRQTQGITCTMIYYYLHTAAFYQIQRQLKIIETSQIKLTDLKFTEIGHITDRLPERAPRRRLAQGNNFQI
jgi:hypothetical protein